MPMATRLLLQALENIPGEQRQIAAQLGMRGYAFFRLVEWPWMRRHIPAVAALIFMLCFASFATVLSLGGGPKATTIELAIYQALSFDYDPARAAMLALIQMLCCLGLVLLSQRLSKAVAIGVSHVRGWRDPDDRLHSRLSDGLLIGAALLLLLPPLLAVIVDGINRNMLDVLAQPALWQALTTSLRIAIAAGLLSVTLTMMLLWSSRELRARQRPLAGQAMELSGMLILAMPGIVLATGFFLLLNNSIGLPESADGIVIFTNALMAIPTRLKCWKTRCATLPSATACSASRWGSKAWRGCGSSNFARSGARWPGVSLRLRAVDWRLRRGGAVRQRGVPHPAFLSVPADRRLPQPGRRRHRPASAAALFLIIYAD